MILDDNMIISAAVGAVRSFKEEQGIIFRRYSEKQETAFYKDNKYFPVKEFHNYFGRNCNTCAGISIDFVSDADAIKITSGKGTYDILVNGKYIKSWNEGIGQISFREKKERRVTIYLSTSGCIQSVDLDGASIFRPYFKSGTDILFIGDSIFQGVGSRHPSRNMPAVLSKRFDARIINQGNSGYVYDSATIDKICDPKLIVLGYGCNDRDRKSENDFYNDTFEFAQKIRETWGNIPVVGVIPIYCFADDEPDYNERYRRYDDLLRKAYCENGISIIEGTDVFPRRRELLCDGSHPTEKGYLIFGNRLAKKISEMGLYK